ncbi:4896_t:CDS:2 [Ambispora gerdemannii]|uniref:4896_t:CDS:1 n=1 Tax=Ambispora gerdemannii TaxID=144530 RepID=A0A9N9AVY7_9GLOM|nr:4896_t:CDS:2 [Ambispora gerdemannii]
MAAKIVATRNTICEILNKFQRDDVMMEELRAIIVYFSRLNYTCRHIMEYEITPNLVFHSKNDSNGSYAQTPGTRQDHCLVTYNNTVYLFGGFINSTSQSSDPNFFFSAALPFTTDTIPWTRLDTKNATSVADPACIVEPDLGYLLIIGGYSDFLRNPGIQVYNFRKQLWNEPNLIQGIPQEFITPTYISYRPRATLIQPGVVFIWAASYNGDDTNSFVYNLTLTMNGPWQWTPIQTNNTNLNVTNSPGIASSKGNAFIFGGLTKELTGFESHKEMYIYNPNYGFVRPNINVSSQVTEYKPIVVIEFDLETFQMSNVEVSSNFIINRRRAAATLIFGSDVVLIHGGIAGPLGYNTTDSMIAYNMTSRNWTTEIAIIGPTLKDDNLNLPTINGFDLNYNPPSYTESLSVGALIGIIFASVTAIAIVSVALTRMWLVKKRQRHLAELADIVNNNDLAMREWAKSRPVFTVINGQKWTKL